jgi:hypothetical protein
MVQICKRFISWWHEQVVAAGKKFACSRHGHVLDLPNKRCSRCLEPAPLCVWCGERLATMQTMYVEKPEHVCRECVGV